MYLISYVDDGLVMCKNEKLIDEFLTEIRNKLNITISENVTCFVCMQIKITCNSIFIRQEKYSYVDVLLKRFRLEDCNAVCVLADPNVKLCKPEQCMKNNSYHQLIGALIFFAIVCRPDVCCKSYKQILIFMTGLTVTLVLKF